MKSNRKAEGGNFSGPSSLSCGRKGSARLRRLHRTSLAYDASVPPEDRIEPQALCDACLKILHPGLRVSDDIEDGYFGRGQNLTGPQVPAPLLM